jgi:hypothetical protein
MSHGRLGIFLGSKLYRALGLVAPRRRRDGRPQCANSGHTRTVWRTGQINPLLPFKVGLMNGREARQSGLRLKAVDRARSGRARRTFRRQESRRAAERQPRRHRLTNHDLAAFFFRLRGFVFHHGVERWARRHPGGARLVGFSPRANWSSLAPASAGGRPWPRPQAALARRNLVCGATCAGRRGRSSGWVPAPQNARA